MTTPIANVNNATLNSLIPNLDIGDVADPALRLAAFQYIYAEMQVIITAYNAFVAAGGIATGNLADLSVTTGKLADLAVTAGKIADLAVVTGKINDLAVTAAKIATGTITSAQIADLGIATADLADALITTIKIADGSVTTAKIADSVVTLAKMADGSVGTTELVDGSITRPKIANSAVGASQLDATLLTDFGDIATQAEFDRRGINVMKYGAVGDGVTDDTAAWRLAIAAAIANKRKIIATGIFLITDEIEVNDGVYIEGMGMDQSNGGLTTNASCVFLFNNATSTKSVFRFKKISNYRLHQLILKNIAFKSIHATVLNQHAITFENADISNSRFDNLMFSSFSGHPIYFTGDNSAAYNTYFQSFHWSDLTFIQNGGGIGQSALASSLSFRMATLGIIDNLNFEGSINPLSPQATLLDLRGFTQLQMRNILSEGTLPADNTITGLKLDAGQVEINGLWNEFSGANHLKENIIISGAGIYKISNATLNLELGLIDRVKITADDVVLEFNGANGYHEDLTTAFNVGTYASKVILNKQIIKAPATMQTFYTDIHKMEYKNVTSLFGTEKAVVSRDNSASMYEFKTGYLLTDSPYDKGFLKYKGALTQQIYTDTQEGRVLKLTDATNKIPHFWHQIAIPSSMYGLNLVYGIRYKIVCADAAIDGQLAFAYPANITTFVGSRAINRQWQNAYFIFHNVQTAFNIEALVPTLTSAVDLLISDIRLSVGSDIPILMPRTFDWQCITTYGTSAPTTGVHLKGDRVINSNPTVGQPKAWICTVAGTPGTWVSEGTL